MAWVPADKGDGIRWEVDDDKRGPHDNGIVKERRWTKRDHQGHKGHFSWPVYVGWVSWHVTWSKAAKKWDLKYA